MGRCYSLSLCASNVLAKTGDAPSKSRLPPTSITSLAAHIVLLGINHLSNHQIYRSHPHPPTSSSDTPSYVNFQLKLQSHRKCLPRLLRRSPQPAARLRLAKHQLRKRKLGRRLPHHQGIRRSAIRQGRKHTPRTSTKVQFALQFPSLTMFAPVLTHLKSRKSAARPHSITQTLLTCHEKS
jgi:hypothetical protein